MLSDVSVKLSNNSNPATSPSNRAARRSDKCELNRRLELNNPESRVSELGSRQEANESSRLSDRKLHVTRQRQREFDRNHRRGWNGLQNNKALHLRWRLSLNQKWFSEATHQGNNKERGTDKGQGKNKKGLLLQPRTMAAVRAKTRSPKLSSA